MLFYLINITRAFGLAPLSSKILTISLLESRDIANYNAIGNQLAAFINFSASLVKLCYQSHPFALLLFQISLIAQQLKNIHSE